MGNNNVIQLYVDNKDWDAIFAQACNVLSYKNYKGTIEHSEEDKCFFGKVLGLRSLLSYEGNSTEELSKNFEKAIDVYLEECKNNGVEPEQPIYGNDDYVLDIPNAETIAAMEDVKCERNLSKSYTDVEEMMADLLKDDETED